MRLNALWLTALLLAGCGTPSADTADTNKGDDDIDTDIDTDDGSACADIQGEGYGEGQISMNWTLQDVDGKSVSLYDYCGQVIYIEDTTAW